MVQGRGGTRLELEPPQAFGIARELGGQNLDRDGPRQADVDGLVDLSHPPRAERREDLVGPEALAGDRVTWAGFYGATAADELSYKRVAGDFFAARRETRAGTPAPHRYTGNSSIPSIRSSFSIFVS